MFKRLFGLRDQRKALLETLASEYELWWGGTKWHAQQECLPELFTHPLRGLRREGM